MISHTTPFLGVPWGSVDTLPSGCIAVVLGIASSLGSPVSGPENGPYFLRHLSKAYTWQAKNRALINLQDRSWSLDNIIDLGDLELNNCDIKCAMDAVENLIFALPDGVVPGVIGGDHSVTLPIVSALNSKRKRPFVVVQFDSHLDLQTWITEPYHELNALDDIFHTNVMSHVANRLGPGNLIQIGVNPYLTVERKNRESVVRYLGQVGTQIPITSSSIEDVRFLQSVIGRGREVYITVDVDVMDRGDMSSTGYPTEIGFRARELIQMIDHVLDGNKLIGFDVVEFSAERSSRDPKVLSDAGRATSIFMHLLGSVVR